MCLTIIVPPQGGIHPDFTGQTYLDILRAVKDAVPDMHVHAFSPLEVSQGAATLGMDLHAYLHLLKDAGVHTHLFDVCQSPCVSC